MTNDEERSLELLKKIFLSENNQKIEQFEEEIEQLKLQLNDKESQISNYYPIINELLERKISESKEEIADILSPVMGLAIKKQVSESKNDIIDALYPVIGETIKKSISENLKEFYTNINTKIENALKRGLLKKRIQSRISGVNTSEIILKDSFPCYIKEVFLIHESTGIMISHVSASEEDQSSDADLISGMLTAIKDFVSESFKSGGQKEQLYEIQYGDSKIIIERGRYSYFAVVISGLENSIFHDELDNLSTELHKKYHKHLREFDGDINKFIRIDNQIRNFIYKINNSDEVELDEKPSPFLAYIFGASLILLLLFIGIPKLMSEFNKSALQDEITMRLDNINGISSSDIIWEIDDTILTVNGKVNSIGLYQSLDSSLKTIEGIKIIENNISVAISKIQTDSLEKYFSKLSSSADFFGASDLRYQIVDNNIILDGKVNSADQKIMIGQRLSNFPGVFGVINNLTTTGAEILSNDQYISMIKNCKLFFDVGESKINTSHIVQVEKFLPFLVNNDSINITVIGYSDNRGSIEMKKLISQRRSESVVHYLRSRGIDENIITNSSNLESNELTHSDNQSLMRKVDFKINILR